MKKILKRNESKESEPSDYHTINCVLVGDKAVGKSHLVCARASGTKYSLSELVKLHVSGIWAVDQYRYNKEVIKRSFANVDGVNVRLHLWDTFGNHDKEREFAYKNADVLVICFSACDARSFANVEKFWLPELGRMTGNKTDRPPIIVCACKIDLRYMHRDEEFIRLANQSYVNLFTEKDVIYPSEGRQLAVRIGAAAYYETSVHAAQFGIEDLFTNCCRAALAHRRQWKLFNKFNSLKSVVQPQPQIPHLPRKPRPPPFKYKRDNVGVSSRVSTTSEVRLRSLSVGETLTYRMVVEAYGERKFSLVENANDLDACSCYEDFVASNNSTAIASGEFRAAEKSTNESKAAHLQNPSARESLEEMMATRGSGYVGEACCEARENSNYSFAVHCQFASMHEFSDIELRVGNYRFKAHLACLIVSSPVFEFLVDERRFHLENLQGNIYSRSISYPMVSMNELTMLQERPSLDQQAANPPVQSSAVQRGRFYVKKLNTDQPRSQKSSRRSNSKMLSALSLDRDIFTDNQTSHVSSDYLLDDDRLTYHSLTTCSVGCVLDVHRDRYFSVHGESYNRHQIATKTTTNNSSETDSGIVDKSVNTISSTTSSGRSTLLQHVDSRALNNRRRRDTARPPLGDTVASSGRAVFSVLGRTDDCGESQLVVRVNFDVGAKVFGCLLEYVYNATLPSNLNRADAEKLALLAELLDMGQLERCAKRLTTGEVHSCESEEDEKRDLDSFRKKRIEDLLLDKKLATDVTFVLEDGEVEAHRYFLSNSCDVVYVMFTSNFAEKSSKQIHFPCISVAAFSLVQHYLYTGDVYVACDDWLGAIELSNRLCLLDLLRRVEENLLNELQLRTKTAAEDLNFFVIHCLSYSKLYDLSYLDEWCTWYLSVNFNHLSEDQTRLLETLPQSVLEHLEKERWPPKWYLKEVELYNDSMKRLNNMKILKKHDGCLSLNFDLKK